MSDYIPKDNTLSLFKNDRKETENHPDYKGSGVVHGTDVWVSAWINTAKNGTKYMSLKVEDKQAAHDQGMGQAQQAAQPSEKFVCEDEGIPF